MVTIFNACDAYQAELARHGMTPTVIYLKEYHPVGTLVERAFEIVERVLHVAQSGVHHRDVKRRHIPICGNSFEIGENPSSIAFLSLQRRNRGPTRPWPPCSSKSRRALFTGTGVLVAVITSRSESGTAYRVECYRRRLLEQDLF